MVDEGQRIIDLEKEIADLKGEIAVLKAKKAESQEKSTMMGNNPTAKQPMKRLFEESSSDLNAQEEDAKRLKLSTEKRPTKVPNWLIEVLAWIGRIEMANSSLSFSTWTFSQLCWPKLHGNVVQQHFVKPLKFVWKRNDELGVLEAKLLNNIGADIPIASVPPPNYISGFTQITINFFDGQVLKFIECVHPILSEIRLYFRLGRISVFNVPCLAANGYFIHVSFVAGLAKTNSTNGQGFGRCNDYPNRGTINLPPELAANISFYPAYSSWSGYNAVQANFGTRMWRYGGNLSQLTHML